MKIRSVVIASGSGSIAGMTLSHNRGGIYMRARVTPTNPNTARQVAVRSAFGQLATRWSTILTAIQREAWNTYGANVAMTNAMGESIFLTGQQQYLRSNTPAIQAGMPIVDDGPTDFNLGDYTTPTLQANMTDGLIVTCTATDAWALEDGSNMLVYGGLVKGPGISFFKGPFRFAGAAEGNSLTPPSQLEVLAPPYALSLGNLIWARAQILRVDGRLSQSVILGPAVISAS